MRRQSILFALIFVFAGACSHDETAAIPLAVDHDVEGSWGPDNHGAIVPGNEFVVALSESSGVIAGTGSFAGEAGPSGRLAVSGTVAHDSLRLQIILSGG